MIGRYAPTGSREQTYPDVSGVVYLTDSTSKDGKPRPCAIAYSGKKRKPDWNFFFRTAEQRETKIEFWLESLRAKQQRRIERAAERKAARKAFANPFKVGDILTCSWGYEQTNVDFYQVVDVTPKGLKMRQIAADTTETGFMSGTTTPCRDAFLSDSPVIQKHLQIGYQGMVYVPMKYGSASKWNGKPCYRSWYA